jgi:hypothetical protein
MRVYEARACGSQACLRALMVSHNLRTASSQFTGLMSTASKALCASVARVHKSRRPVHANRAVCRVAGSARNASATTNPSSPGMRKSQRTASGTSCVARKTPRMPPFARSTKNPCASSAAWALSRKSASSSTISTRGSAFPDVSASLALSDIPFPPRVTLVEAPTRRCSKAPTEHCLDPNSLGRNVWMVRIDRFCARRAIPFFSVFLSVKPLGFVRRGPVPFGASTGWTRIRAPGERT